MKRHHFKLASRLTAQTPPDQWPVLLTMAEVAVILRVSYHYVSRKTAAGTFAPLPVSDANLEPVKPYRWHREALRQFCEHGLRRAS